MNILIHCWQFLPRIGARANSSYLDLKRVYMVNMIAMVCVLPAFIFALINFFDGRLMLSIINFLNAVCFTAVILLQLYRNHHLAKIVLIASSLLFFFIGGLLYRNGGEYFLLCVLIVTMLLYDNLAVLITVGTVVIFAVLIIVAFPDFHVLESAVPKERALFNIMSSLFFIIITVSFFKHVIYHDKQQIEKQRLKLEEMNIEKEKIFSIVAHDMRAPLVDAGNIIDILQTSTLDGPALKQIIGQLQQQINEQNKVLESILQWSSTKMKGIRSRRSLVSVHDLIADIVQTFKVQYTRKKLLFDVTIDRDLQVFADRDHLMIIFRNLISNAIKFSHVGGEIKIYVSEHLDRTHVHIEDQGVGILNSQSDVLFDRVQKRSLGTANEPGSGLGLVLCKELIELKNGDININSCPEQGSIFTVGFPNAKNN